MREIHNQLADAFRRSDMQPDDFTIWNYQTMKADAAEKRSREKKYKDKQKRRDKRKRTGR